MNLICPVEHQAGTHITLAHGAGGVQTRKLVETVFLPAFGADSNQEDAALLDMCTPHVDSRGNAARWAMTTDSYVVNPLEFPGGNIGDLAVAGTCNDLAMRGAIPKYLSAGFILEEGLSITLLTKIVRSMAAQAKDAGVQIITGDTKVVERGKGDGVFINTAGVGVVADEFIDVPGINNIAAGNAVILSNDIGRHGAAVLASREQTAFDSDIVSDCALLSPVVGSLASAGIVPRAMRDLTRGGLATALVEMADGSGMDVHITESQIPIHPMVDAACEVFGLNALQVANEGCFALFVAESDVEKALGVLRQWPQCRAATRIGVVREAGAARPRVLMQTAFGSDRLVHALSGEQLPRIC
ncbi:Carbamoyl dehydratase HypE [BD1-7 clade bacterium]|uniref:Carbamoyl dehydratase HypE n=1 Tax=BD1-7 clade bacterium TaxID=2029982 RepID=A0A5S9QPI0_9GAMM|nr:Carbamoyl dehydratase HypE [BD1-7 clade bacterium]